MSAPSRQFWELVASQHGAIAHEQLRALGLGDGAIRHRISRGDLHKQHRGVYAVGRPDLTFEGQLFAALLAAGEGAAISHETALALWGISPVTDEEPIHVSVADVRHPSHRNDVRVHRRKPMPPITACGDIPVVEPLHTLLDVAARWPPHRLEAAINEADKLGLVRFDAALALLDDLAGKRGIRKLREAFSAHTATDSDLERRFLKLALRAGLPRPLTQARVCGLRVGFCWPELRLVVETDGLTYHRTPSQQARDRRRDQILTAAGMTPLRFTNAQVRREEAAVIATLTAVAKRQLAT
jgi:very-short-patch-repair endonuclease